MIIDEPIEIIVIDSNKSFVDLIHVFFEIEKVIYKRVIGFNYHSAAVEYLNNYADSRPKLIFLETIDSSGMFDNTFFEKYKLLKRNDFVYVVSVSTEESEKSKCLS